MERVGRLVLVMELIHGDLAFGQFSPDGGGSLVVCQRYASGTFRLLSAFPSASVPPLAGSARSSIHKADLVAGSGTWTRKGVFCYLLVAPTPISE